MSGELIPIVAHQAGEVGKPLRTAVGSTLADFWQGIVGDRATAWRLRNAAKLSIELEKQVADSGLVLKGDSLPESYAFRWFDKASEEDEADLQALFAKLLINAASGNKEAMERQNIDLLSRMTPASAQILSDLSIRLKKTVIDFPSYNGNDALIIRDFGPNDQMVRGSDSSSMALLVSIGILRYTTKIVNDRFSSERRHFRKFEDVKSIDVSKMVKVEQKIRLTALGLTLLRALESPSDD